MEQLELEEGVKSRQPSLWWLFLILTVTSIIFSTTFAPRFDVYFVLVCEHLRPGTTSAGHAAAFSTTSRITSWKAFAIPPKECLQDAQAQTAVAGLNTILTALSGGLGCLTVGWWGQFSDRHGRIVTLVICLCGMLINDVIFLLVARFFHLLPGGYNFLIVGAVLGSLFGGIPTFIAVVSSYVTDTSPPDLRARNLSLKSGLMSSGFALGPSLGSYIVKRTNDLLSVFYLAFIAILLLSLLMLCVVPEPLTKASMRKAQRHREQEAKAQHSSRYQRSQSASTILIFYLDKIFAFARPIGILLPHQRGDGGKWDYNLFLVAMTMFINMLTLGTRSFNTQYLQRTFGWSSTTTGYWLSVVFIVKAICLVILIPLIIQIVKSKPSPTIQLSEEEESLLAEQEEIRLEHIARNRSPLNPQPIKTTHHIASFDYKLTLFSLIMEVMTYFFMALARTPVQFTLASMMGGLASGFHPGIKSVAISLYEQSRSSSRGGSEAGRLFGALGIVEALSGDVLGPILFGFVFMKTVEMFPQTIYVVAFGTVVLGPIFFLLIRLPSATSPSAELLTVTSDALLDDPRSPERAFAVS